MVDVQRTADRIPSVDCGCTQTPSTTTGCVSGVEDTLPNPHPVAFIVRDPPRSIRAGSRGSARLPVGDPVAHRPREQDADSEFEEADAA
jgi:hypothetical protein